MAILQPCHGKPLEKEYKGEIDMIIKEEISLENFQAWNGAVDTLDRIIEANKCDELEAILEELYPDGMTDTELNDLLWFDDEQVYEWLGIRSESVINEELENLRDELEALYADLDDLKADFEEQAKDLDESERNELWDNDFYDDVEDLENQIVSLREEIEELEDELENL